MRGYSRIGCIKTPFIATMTTCNPEFLSLRQIAESYRGAGTLATWRCRLRRNTGGLRGIARKVGGSIRFERRDLEAYLGRSNG